ncbi:hypothetical protein HWV62_38795 [Athelia sp. TMB]|nr:hypothetical protein HWV62_38795 [Athelia sp. TMB]
MSAMEKFEETMRNAIDQGIIPGAVVVATNKSDKPPRTSTNGLGTLNYTKAFGKTGVSPDSMPMTLQSTFWIASCTKLLTAIACLQCAEKGLFSFESPEDVARLLPEYANPEILTGFDDQGNAILKPAKNRLTLRHMLTHSSGIGYDFYSPQLMAWRKSKNQNSRSGDMSFEDYVMPLLFEPGESWEYGCGTDWAGLLVERASGLKLDAYMKQHIWAPLGIENLTFHLETNEEVKRQLVNVSARVPSSGLLVHSPSPLIADPAKDAMGGGGVYGNPIDYSRILASILRDDGKLLKSESVERLFRPEISEASKRTLMERVPAGSIGPSGTDVSWSLGGMVNSEDVDGRRRKGSLAWGGLPNLFWWIDREGGVTGIYASQIVPPRDPQSGALFSEFEKMVYTTASSL